MADSGSCIEGCGRRRPEPLEQVESTQGPAKRRKQGSAAHIVKPLASPFADTKSPFGDREQPLSKHLVNRTSQDDTSTAVHAGTPLQTVLPSGIGGRKSGVASNIGGRLSITDCGPLKAFPTVATGKRAGQWCFEMELSRQRARAEEEYVHRLKSLADAARSLEEVLLARCEECCSAESGLAEIDLEALISGAVGRLEHALYVDRQNRESLRAELKAATSAYYGGGGPATRAHHTAPQESLAAARAAQQQRCLRQGIQEAAKQLRSERESHEQALTLMAAQHRQEQAALLARLHEQAAQLTAAKALLQAAVTGAETAGA